MRSVRGMVIFPRLAAVEVMLLYIKECLLKMIYFNVGLTQTMSANNAATRGGLEISLIIFQTFNSRFVD